MHTATRRHTTPSALLTTLLAALLLALPLLAVPQPASAQDTTVLFASFGSVATARPGEQVQTTGTLVLGDLGDASALPSPVSVPLNLVLTGPEGQQLDLGGAIPDANGAFEVTVPASATADEVIGNRRNGFTETWAVRAVAQDGRAVAGAGAVAFAQAAGVQVEYDFTSSVGWVKPGDPFPARVIVTNFDATEAAGLSVTIPPVDGREVEAVRSATGAAVVDAAGAVQWTDISVGGASDAGPGQAVLVVEAMADSTAQDPEIVWKDLSATAVLSTGAEARSHGPKVIPPNETFDTARYGDRPFPVVPVDFYDFSHLESSNSAELDSIINSPDFEGSTFNLFQEMSYGQLFPNGVVPSAGIATADFSYEGSAGEGFDFHSPVLPPPNTCTGADFVDTIDSPLYSERIVDGWYRLPGDQRYYGQDSGGSNLFPSLGVPVPTAQIDSGCGDTGKAVYDAAAIADPEIDYNDFDTDKDGVVDFFMMIFVGCGGNGVSQLAVVADCTNYPNPGNQPEPYDNIWPHSSTLEGGFRDPDTGLLGYVSDDRLTDLEGNLLSYTDDSYTVLTTEDTAFPAYVRVGPYNVNPESIFDAASVISHEYGHSLGLPDYYNISGGLDVYADWNLMASDYSQHMDANGRQELGWVVPVDIPEGTNDLDLVGSKTNINRIEWETPDGTPYVLEGEDVNNGLMYRAGLPSRIIIDPALLENGASPTHTYWSTSGNDYACPTSPNARALDLSLPQLADIAPGTPVELSFASLFHIEWEFDYGFIMVTTDSGNTYVSLPSEEGFTTPSTTNPNNVACQAEYGNGITGITQSYEDGTADVDRLLGSYPANDGFATDRYDLSDFAGMDDVVVRFGYVTDVGLAEPGWFIDDISVTADGDELYAIDFEDGPKDPQLFNGGCQSDSGLGTAPLCSDGFQYVSATDGSPADHAYYLQLRDRSGFDLDGFGQSDRGALTWEPGVELVYTDENYSYGNVSVSDHPAQTILDAVPEPGSDSPDLTDAAFNAGESFSDSGDGHVDNYSDPARQDGQFRFDFDCLSLEVTDMAGDTVDVDGDGMPTDSAVRADDITATVSVTRGSGCVERDFGFTGPSLTRLAGPGRVQTAVEVSKAAYPDGATTAVIAQAGNFPDALAAAPLAADLDAPVLLTDTDRLRDEVATELERLGVTDVVLLGGEGALSAGVESALGAYTVTRLAGEGRIGTSVEVARALADGGELPGAVLVRADAFPDALAASNLAIAAGIPILLTDSAGLSAQTAAALSELVAPGAVVYLAGGTSALDSAVADDVETIGFVPKRLAGSSRYGTATAITDEALSLDGVAFDAAMLASGTNFPDALAAGPAAAALDGLLVLVDPGALANSPDSSALLAANASGLSRLFVAGGTAAVSDAVAAEALALVGG